MSKDELAALIDAYAAAKTTGNQILIREMVTKVERALDVIFDTKPAEPSEF